MQNKPHNISGTQLVLLLCISRIFVLFTYVPKGNASVNGSAALLVNLLTGIASLLLICPFLYLCKISGPDIITSALRVNCIFGKLAAALFCLYSLFIAAYTISHFEFFMTSTVYPKARPWLFVIFLTITAAYAAALGLEAFSRMSMFVFSLTAAVTISIFLSLLPEMNLFYVSNPLLTGAQPVLAGTVRAAASNAEIILFMLLLPRTGGKKAGTRFITWVVITAVFYELLTFTVLTALGDYSKTRMFPIHTAATIVQLPIIGRLDILHIGVWIFTAFLRAALYLYCAYTCLRRIFPKLSIKTGTIICALAAGATALLTSSNMRFWQTAGQLTNIGIIFGVMVIVLPILTILFLKLKKDPDSGVKGAS